MRPDRHTLDPAQCALVELGQALKREGYSFTTVTPETHRRINVRAADGGRGEARDLRDVFGWSRPFSPSFLPKPLLDLLIASGEHQVAPSGLMRSAVRFSTLQQRMFVHSAFPTLAADSVFFGPDTYRFCSLLHRWAPEKARYVVDIGVGAGAGAILLAPRAERVVAVDVNPRALSFTAVNAALAATPVTIVNSDLMQGVSGTPDLIIANPPFMRDAAARKYRDGGGEHGEGLSLRIVREALSRLAIPGELILYTGTTIVDGIDQLSERIVSFVCEHGTGLAYDLEYEELDPDVFGEELMHPAYADADRIAVVGLHLRLS